MMQTEAKMRTATAQRVQESAGVMRCPSCRSIALYRYGKVKNRQRFLCLICGRQFIDGHARFLPRHRPLCPVCGKPMHIYKQVDSSVRYRCSSYPACRTFIKIKSTRIEE